MDTVPCPLCGIPVHFRRVGVRTLRYEALIDIDQPYTDVPWVQHTEDRCRFAVSIAGLTGEKRS
jgi:hypothetical protein